MNATLTLSDRPAAELATMDAAENIQKIYKLVKDTINGDLNEEEFQLFMHDCKRQGVHPLDRLIHPTIRKDNKTGVRRYVAITSIDLFRARAEMSGGHAGTDDPVFKGDLKTGDFQATVTVWRMVEGQRCPFTATARWSEYKPSPPHDFIWNKMPHGQLGKCAEALALRKAYPRLLHGLYEKAEMEQAHEPIVVPIEEPKTVNIAEPIKTKEPLTFIEAAQQTHDKAKANGYQPVKEPELDDPPTPEEVAEIERIEREKDAEAAKKQQEEVLGKRPEKIPNDAEVMLVDVVGFNPNPRTLSNGSKSYSLKVKMRDGDHSEEWTSTFNRESWETGKLLKGHPAHLTYKWKNGYLNFFHIEKA